MAPTAGCVAKWRTVMTRIGAAPKRKNCFGMRPPKRAPTPPAGMTTATLPTMRCSGLGFTLVPSAEQRRQGVADRGHAVDVERHLRRLEDIAPRHDRSAEAQGGRLTQT